MKIQETKGSDLTDVRWWQNSHRKMRDALFAAFGTAKAASGGRDTAYARLRELADTGELETDDAEGGGGVDGAIQGHCDNNVIGQVHETGCSKLLENRPDAQILTDGGQDTAQRRGKELARWVNSASRSIELYDVVEEAWDEAQKVGTGAFRVFHEHGRPAAEVAYCEDLHVNPIEAKHNAVRTLYYERRMDRAALAALFPEHRNKIGDVGQMKEEDSADQEARSWSDMVTVVEAWRLALAPAPTDGEADRAKVGRHVIAIKDVTLLDEEYGSTTMPFRFLRWRKRSRSFWGIGIPEILERQQTQLNLHAGTVEASLEMLVPQAWVEDGENVQRIDNIPGRLNSGAKAPTFSAAHPGLLAAFTQREDVLTERMFAAVGVSRMEAQAQKPAGLNSGRAQLVHQDIKSKRLLLQGRQIEDAYAWAFRRLIEVADELVEMGEGQDADALTYLAGEGQDVRETAYADVRISEFMFEAKVYPVSKLPDSPAGRLEFVMELLNAEIIPREDAMGLLSLPDIEGYAASKASMRDLARALCDHAASGEFENVASLVTPLDDYAEIIAYGHQLFARLRLDGKTADELGELSALMTRAADAKADAEKAAAEAAAPPPQMPPGPMPGVPPMPPAGPGGEPPMM